LILLLLINYCYFDFNLISLIIIINNFIILGLGNNSYTILQDIIDNFPGLSLRSLHISPIDKLHGVNLINSMLNLQTSIHMADGIMLRGFDDINNIITLSNNEGKDNNDGHIQNYLSYMASDVFVAFSNNIIKGSTFNNIGGSGIIITIIL